MHNRKPLLQNNKHNPIVFHTLLWGCSYIILLFLFSKGKWPIIIDCIYTACFLVLLVIPVIIDLYVLIPRFLKKEAYTIFILLFLLNVLAFVSILLMVFQPIIDTLFPDYYFISYYTPVSLAIIFCIFLMASTLIKLSEDWFYFNTRENRLLKLQNQEIQMQLATLRSQINPHFLFNALNVIYALTLENAKETPTAIVQLSDILRYVIYDSNVEMVSLKDEIQLLKNYIAFQQLRQEVTTDIKMNITIEDEEYPIFPMLLLPLVENSFKHGLNAAIDNAFIDLRITQSGRKFKLELSNNLPAEPVISTDQSSGLGIDNIQRNLEIVYPDAYRFNTSKTETTFTVVLEIESL